MDLLLGLPKLRDLNLQHCNLLSASSVKQPLELESLQLLNMSFTLSKESSGPSLLGSLVSSSLRYLVIDEESIEQMPWKAYNGLHELVIQDKDS
ncbi:hypothetical protein FRB90_003703, partial [Tulasnella sp. 427]